jgi:galactokinase
MVQVYTEELKQLFKELFHRQAQLVLRAPGRINLIGEHTDYNGGFVLPAAMDKAIYFAVAKRDDGQCHLYSENMSESHNFLVDQLKKDGPSWSNYIKGVLAELQRLGLSVGGFDMVFGGDIPLGAGVSSSAALECGVAYAMNVLYNLGLDKLHLVKLAQAAENNFVGVNCGIMDQFASMMGKKNSVIQLDCRSLDYKYFPFEMQEYVVVLCDTGVKHNLGASEYNTRRNECEAGVAILKKHYPKVETLRDVPVATFLIHEKEFPEVVFKRCKYVVEEIARVEEACALLLENDLEAFGVKMYETHDGLQHLYAVSCEELDFLVDQTRNNAHVIGSRMMGGGFGGCTINLVHKDFVDAFIKSVAPAYQQKFGIALKTYQSVISDGVSVLEQHLDAPMGW